MNNEFELDDNELKMVSGGIAYYTILYKNKVVDMDEIKKIFDKKED